jgi:deoxyribodipyrimidine photolyase-related protein
MKRARTGQPSGKGLSKPKPKLEAESQTERRPQGRGAGGGGVLAVVLGDQLDAESAALSKLDPARDHVVMMEVRRESEHVPSHVQRTVLFLSAMRHFAAELRARGLRVRYVTLDDPANTQTLGGEITRAARELGARTIRVVEPGEHRVRAEIVRAAADAGATLEVMADRHFLTDDETFASWARGRRALTMEYFYREQRQRLDVLMERGADGKPRPVGGEWNYDHDNRESFGKKGPGKAIPTPLRFRPDAVTREVMSLVERQFPKNPGRLEMFAWPVTRTDALRALDDFVRHRLALFGPYEDAMWTSEAFVYHSALSPLLNLKLLDPRECVEAAVAALARGDAPLQSVEAFVRQIIGWREYIRGVYRLEGPSYGERNFLAQHGRLPRFYWDGETEMACVRACVGQVIEHGYGHHIQRLMVTGNLALLAGVHPREVSDWYLAMYVDGVDWVTLPNALGMVMHADGVVGEKAPVVGTKPYAASGQYISRMSNYCTKCRYDPAERTGPKACPITTLYWDFLRRNRAYLERNPRMGQVIKNLDRFGETQVQQITVSARSLRERWGVGDIEKPRPPTVDHRGMDYSAGPAARGEEMPRGLF